MVFISGMCHDLAATAAASSSVKWESNGVRWYAGVTVGSAPDGVAKLVFSGPSSEDYLREGGLPPSENY